MGKNKERVHEQPRWPIDDCSYCGQDSPMTQDNTRFEIYECYPLATHFFTVCVNCEEPTRIFTESRREDVEHMGYPVLDQRRVPTPVVLWSANKAHQIEDIKPHELSEQEEAQVQFARYVLEHEVEITVADFI